MSVDPYSSQNLQKYMNYVQMINLIFYLPYTPATEKYYPVTRKMTIFSTHRTLFDGIMFLTACDVDFILKCEWIHISGESMWNVYLSKTKVHHEMTHSIHNVCRTLSCVHRKKLFEFLKYNNICSLTAILNESISKLCGLSTKYAQIWGTVKITPCDVAFIFQLKSFL
jgi:hypothetical protein